MATDQFDFTDLVLGDSVDVRVDVTVTTTSINEVVEIAWNLAVGGFSYPIPIVQRQFKSAGTYKIVAMSSVYMGDTNTLDNPAELTIETDNTGSSAVCHGWYVRVFPRVV